MSWINENKSAAITIGVGAVLTLGLIGAGIKFSGEAKEAELAYQNNLSSINTLEAAPTSPEPETVKELGDLVEVYSDRVAALKERLTKFGVDEIKPVTGQEFNDELKAQVVRFNSSAKAKGIIVPEEFYMGFEEYREKLPKSEAAGHLNYELNATSWLLDQLLESGLERVISIVRKPIKIEESPVTRARATSSSKRKAAPVEVMVTMPIEVVVEVEKGAWAKILSSIAASDSKHFFVIRGLRVVNEKTQGPDKNAVKFEEKAVVDIETDFDFIVPEAEIEEDVGELAEDVDGEAQDQEIPTEADGEEIVKSVLGTESIFIALQLEAIHFLSDVEIPGGSKKETQAPTGEPQTN